jgi:hypothetical protein
MMKDSPKKQRITDDTEVSLALSGFVVDPGYEKLI